MTDDLERDVILSVRDVSRTFGAYRAVDGVSFEVVRGEVLGIAGPNGAGKSTLFNLITGVPFHATSGQIEFLRERVEHVPGHRLCRSGLRRTFQADQVFPGLTVHDNVRLAARYLNGRGGARHVLDSLERTGLSEIAGELASDISVLAKKKLMIAGALVGAPEVLMLDEPAGGLDLDDQDELAELIEALNGDGLTVVVIEHVLRLLRRVSDRMIVMVAGKILVEGQPDDVLSDPRVVEAYLGEALV